MIYVETWVLKSKSPFAWTYEPLNWKPASPSPHPAGEPYTVDGILVDGPDNHKGLWVSASCQCARLNRAYQLGWDARGKA